MNPRINVRNIPSPLEWGRRRDGMIWHHIIPNSLLTEVWNRLVDQLIATQLSEARVAIWQYLSLSNPNLPNLDSLVGRIRAENLDQQRAGHNPLPRLNDAEALHLATTAVWPAWDIVEGPQDRTDDPGDHYIDRFTVGLTPPELARMSAIEELYKQFREFESAGPAPGAASLRKLAQAASIARPTVYCRAPLRYRPEMWVQDSDGHWRKRRHAGQ